MKTKKMALVLSQVFMTTGFVMCMNWYDAKLAIIMLLFQLASGAAMVHLAPK